MPKPVRARIVFYAADGLGNDEIAARLDTPRQVVSKWRKRFVEQRLPGLADLPRRGGPRSDLCAATCGERGTTRLTGS